jgi:hypothetical protein
MGRGCDGLAGMRMNEITNALIKYTYNNNLICFA